MTTERVGGNVDCCDVSGVDDDDDDCNNDGDDNSSLLVAYVRSPRSKLNNNNLQINYQLLFDLSAIYLLTYLFLPFSILASPISFYYYIVRFAR